MADFIPSKKTAQDFNNGVKYIDGDGDITGDAIQAESINNVIESALYSQTVADNVKGLADNQPDTSEAANVGTPTVSIIEAPNGTAQFKFANLKGDKGDVSAEEFSEFKTQTNKAIADISANLQVSFFVGDDGLMHYKVL